jgi:hypothetical protein
VPWLSETSELDPTGTLASGTPTEQVRNDDDRGRDGTTCGHDGLSLVLCTALDVGLQDPELVLQLVSCDALLAHDGSFAREVLEMREMAAHTAAERTTAATR